MITIRTLPKKKKKKSRANGAYLLISQIKPQARHILSNSLPWNQPQPPNVAEQPHARSEVHWGTKEGYSPLTHRETFERQIGIEMSMLLLL